MATVLVTVAGPARECDLDVPADVPIAEIIVPLLVLCGPDGSSGGPTARPVDPAAFQLGSLERLAFPGERTLAQCGVVDGAQLVLQHTTFWLEQAARQQVVPPPALDHSNIRVRWNKEGLFPGA